MRFMKPGHNGANILYRPGGYEPDIPRLQMSVGIQNMGGIVLMPERVDDQDNPIPGGLYGPDPADSSMIKLIYGYAIVPLGNGGKSCIETVKIAAPKNVLDKKESDSLQISVHLGKWDHGVMAFLDPINLGESNELKISSFATTALHVMNIVSVVMLVICIVVLCLAIIHLFVPG